MLVGTTKKCKYLNKMAVCAMVMRRDFDYWEIDELLLEPCCALKFYPKVELCNTQIEKDISDKEQAEKDRVAENFGQSRIAKFR